MYLIKIELKKLYRCSIVWVGAVVLLCAPLLSILQQQSFNEPTVDFSYTDLISAVIWNSMALCLPVTLALLGGYMISREYTDHTLEELFVIPISYQKLMLSKVGALLVLAIFYSFYELLLTTVISVVLYPIGLNLAAFLRGLLQFCGMGICIGIAVMPIVCWCGTSKNRFLAGTVISFVYGFFSIPIAGHDLQDYYPISAGLSIIRFTGDTGGQIAQRPEIAFLVLGAMVALSVIILLTNR